MPTSPPIVAHVAYALRPRCEVLRYPRLLLALLDDVLGGEGVRGRDASGDDVVEHAGAHSLLGTPRSDPQFQIMRCFSSHEPIDVDAEAPAAEERG
eukprot:CAMPEP_0182482288 /NCGR_PEP_ID=MMETSP1319-20130603/38984_1 /TAXON_ID=172717 /ORGANISM="Bolidomonas pacifica, Strain RCC208" /LENGTH=95 /DNA_ID=CAMNT_0024683995 /DNA_START=223 /DNA_END=507 /DNA_ORIENTATION=-